MVALRSSNTVSFERVYSHLLKAWPQFPGGRRPLDADEEAAVIPIPGGSITFGYMGAPIPWGDLEWPTRAAWHWPEAADALRNHRAHLLVFGASDELSQVGLTLLLTQAVAAAVAVTDAAGVYVGNASLVIEPDIYVAEATDATLENLPVLLWIGVHLVQKPDGLSAYTTGLESFGCLELEVHDSALQPAILAGRLADVAEYQLRTGNHLEDGDTFGSSPDERLRIRHGPSRYLSGTQTCQLVM